MDFSRLSETARLVGSSGGPVLVYNNNMECDNTRGRLVRFTRGCGVPVTRARTKGNVIP